MKKRTLDLLIALPAGLVLAPVIVLIALAVLIVDGRPVFYVSERMRAPGRSFGMIKFRTMRPDADDSGVSGGDKAARISRLGAVLRRNRLDELPQIWNVLRGDMSLVGPRPPLRVYVEDYPELYAAVLRSRPGITGLATLVFASREAALLRHSQTAGETDAIYRRRCLPLKARLDLIYQKNQSVCGDLWVMGQTVRRLLGRDQSASSALTRSRRS